MAPRHSTLASSGPISALGVVAPPPIEISSPNFDGTLATLFGCVRDHRVDLLGVPLLPICEAYFAYLLAGGGSLEEAAAALVALAYLLERKAWMLLPAPDAVVEPELDEPFELPTPTSAEYRVAIEALRLWHEERSLLFFRAPDAGPDLYELPYTLSNVSPSDLARAFERVMKRATAEPPDHFNKPRRSLEEMMRVVLATLRVDWQPLDQIVVLPISKPELVYWFLALLELMRLGQVRARVANEDVLFALADAQMRLEARPEAG